jgi:CBS domain-containing protein
MTAQAIMSTDLRTLSPHVSVGEALLIMCAHKVHNLPVVDADGGFVGLFSLRRVTHALLPMAAQLDEDTLDFDVSFVTDSSDAYLERLRRLGDTPVAELLEKKRKLRFCSPDTPIPRLLQLLSENPTSLPVLVVEGKIRRVVGMVSTWDVLTKIAVSLFGESTNPGEGNPAASQDGN